MATIAEIREKYPQYSDMPDAALADALHSKFYADMPKTDFYTKVGLTPSEGMPKPRTAKEDADEAIKNAKTAREAFDISQENLKGNLSAASNAALAQSINTGYNVMGYLGKGIEAVGGERVGKAIQYASKEIQKRAEEHLVGADRERYPAAVGMGGLASDVAVTMPVGGLIGKVLAKGASYIPALAPYLNPVATSAASGGFKTGLGPTGPIKPITGLPSYTAKDIAAEGAARTAGGALTSGISTAITHPEDTAMGTTAGAIIPTVVAPLVKGAVTGAGRVIDLLSGRAGDIKAARIAKTALGDQLIPATLALQQARPGITAIQALQEAGIDAAPFMSLGVLAEQSSIGEAYRRLAAAQTQEQKNMLIAMSGGANATTARQSAEGSINALNANVVPQGQAALERANIGNVVTKGVQPEVNSAVNRGNKPTFDNAPSAATAQTQLDMLAAAGLKPIDTSAIVGSIESKLANPKIGPSDVTSGVLNKVSAKVKEWTAKGGGYIDAEALYTIRKNAVNEEVQRLMGTATPTAQARYAAKLLNEINPLIDDAIEAAGGKGWKEYLKTYAAGRQKVEQKQMAAQIQTMFDKGDEQQVIDLIRGKNPDAIENVFGPGSYNVFVEMADKMPQLSKFAGQLERDIAVKEAADSATQGLARIMGMAESKVTGVPAFFSKTATAVNMAAKILRGQVNEKTFAAFEKGMISGKTAAEMLGELPTSERNKVFRLLKNSSEWNPAVSNVGIQSSVDRTNNLAPPSENRNNLRQ